MEPVNPDELIPGKDYYIQNNNNRRKKIGTFREKLILTPTRIKFFFNNIRNVDGSLSRVHNTTLGFMECDNNECSYYEVKKPEILKNVERRAYTEVFDNLGLRDRGALTVDLVGGRKNKSKKSRKSKRRRRNNSRKYKR
jgi:hypothetical protein